MRATWNAPANQYRAHFPVNRTLREHAMDLHAQGLSYGVIGVLFGMEPQCVQHGCAYKPRLQKERKPLPPRPAPASSGRPLTAKEKRRLAKAYGLTWQQLQAIRAAGLTVKQFREMAAEMVA